MSIDTDSNPSLLKTNSIARMATQRPAFGKTQVSLQESAKVPPKTEKHVVRNSILAGSIAGMTSSATCYPFELLRVKLQSGATVPHRGAVSASGTRKAVGGPIQILIHTVKHGGIRALYTGLALPLKAQAVYKATIFSVNNTAKETLAHYKLSRRQGNVHEPTTLTRVDTFLCGAAGGIVNGALFVTPVEYVRNQLIAQQTRLAAATAGTATAHAPKHNIIFRGPRDVLRHTIINEGITKLWRGIGTTVVRDSLGVGCFFLTFRYVSECVSGREHPPDTTTKLVAGGAAGLAFWVTALPIDTLKTWVQSGVAESPAQALRDCVAKVGVVATAQRLCRGWQVAFGRGIPAAAITMATYEFAYNVLQEMGDLE